MPVQHFFLVNNDNFSQVISLCGETFSVEEYWSSTVGRRSILVTLGEDTTAIFRMIAAEFIIQDSNSPVEILE